MISVVFPGQGSQKLGMGSDLYNKFEFVKNIFKNADEILGYKISDLILNGPQEKLNQTTFTQPAIYLIGHVICEILKKETNFFQNKINFFAGHSLGEYTALTTANVMSLEQGLVLLKNRGESMQSAVPLGEGGMLAVLGIQAQEIKNLIEENFKFIRCFLANDNSNGQLILSGKNTELDKFALLLKEKKIKNIKLPVSAPFHCELMRSATIKMKKIINEQKLESPKYRVVSMWMQQKLNPTPPDPVQAKIFMFFPLFLTVILAPFPAGLVIYWTINNILTMAQQYIIIKRTTVKTV